MFGEQCPLSRGIAFLILLLLGSCNVDIFHDIVPEIICSIFSHLILPPTHTHTMLLCGDRDVFVFLRPPLPSLLPGPSTVFRFTLPSCSLLSVWVFTGPFRLSLHPGSAHFRRSATLCPPPFLKGIFLFLSLYHIWLYPQDPAWLWVPPDSAWGLILASPRQITIL